MLLRNKEIPRSIDYYSTIYARRTRETRPMKSVIGQNTIHATSSVPRPFLCRRGERGGKAGSGE